MGNIPHSPHKSGLQISVGHFSFMVWQKCGNEGSTSIRLFWGFPYHRHKVSWPASAYFASCGAGFMHICNIHILIPTPWTSPNAEAAKVYQASSLWIEIPYTSGSFDGNNGLDGSLEPLKAVLCSPPVKFLAGGEHSWFISAWYADNCILCVFLTFRKISGGEHETWIFRFNQTLKLRSSATGIAGYLLRWYSLRAFL